MASPDLIPSASITYSAFPSRGIQQAASQHMRYGLAEYKGQTVHVAQFFDSSGTCFAQKLRLPNKQFRWLGDHARVTVFGEWKMPDKGRKLYITEGELDALAVYQTMGSWPVISLPDGAGSAKKSLKRILDKLEQFDEVVLCFDNDDQGAKAVKEVLPLFTPGRVKIAQLPLKDACDMLAAKRRDELWKCLLNARVYRPEGIVDHEDVWDRIINERVTKGVPYPFDGLNEFLKGRRPKELVLITAGTGAGKSTLCRQLADNFCAQKSKVGYVALEESVRQSALGIYGMRLGKAMLALEEDLDLKELKEVHDAFSESLVLFDHFGSTETDMLVSKLRFLVKAMDCDVLFLDHISIAISGLGLDDERKALDKMMTDLRSLVEETGCTLLIVSHLRRAKDGSHEEGKPIQLSDLRGSQSLAQSPDIVLAVERNQQDADEGKRNTLVCRVLKNRPAQRLGVAAHLEYDRDTGRLKEIPMDDAASDFAVDDEDFS